jgi:hypothetical protein
MGTGRNVGNGLEILLRGSVSMGLLVGLLTGVAANAAQFRNLDFEEATTNRVFLYQGATVGPLQDLLPGWNVVVKRIEPGGYTNNLDLILFDSRVWDEVNVAVIDFDPYPPEFHYGGLGTPKTGKYSLEVEPLGFGYVGISQRAEIPSNTRGIVFDGAWGGAVDQWFVSLFNENFAWTNIVRPTWFIPFPVQFAGTSTRLEIGFGPGAGIWRLDAINFAPALEIARNSQGELTMTVALGFGPQRIETSASVLGPWEEWATAPAHSVGGNPMYQFVISPGDSVKFFRTTTIKFPP